MIVGSRRPYSLYKERQQQELYLSKKKSQEGMEWKVWMECAYELFLFQAHYAHSRGALHFTRLSRIYPVPSRLTRCSGSARTAVSCCIPPIWHPSFLKVISLFWSTTSNAFHFSFRMISPTLLDVAAITGLPPNAETVHPFASVPEFSDPWPTRTLRGVLIRLCCLSFSNSPELRASEHGRIYLLSYWLCPHLL